MKKRTLFAALLALLLAGCSDSGADTTRSTAATRQSPAYTVAGLQLLSEANPEWQFEQLRLYPIVAQKGAIAAGDALPMLKTLAEGMEMRGFRITERKRFGRGNETWYNALTVQNKSQDPVFLMAGDVVQGGNQDRVIAYDDVILPGTLKNIDVFCVESGRSSYFDPKAPEPEKRVAAFRGYYNVASPQVRKAVYNGDQRGVWDAVASVTASNKAESHTNAYAALETENEQKAKREACLHFFQGKFSDIPNVVGMVAVCNGQVLGVDIFSRPDMFKRQFNALLHGYAAEAAVAPTAPSGAGRLALDAFKSVAMLAEPNANGSETAGKFSLNGNWVHLFRK